MTELKSLTDFVYESSGKDVARVQTDIDREVYDYFFHHVICYKHGARKCILAFFIQRFYEECQQQKIPKLWDEDSEPKVLAILNKLNFNERTTTATRKPSRRRSNPSSIKYPQEPDCS